MSDIVTARTFSDGEKGITATKLNEIQSKAVIQPDLVGTRPASSSLDPNDQLLVLKTNNTLARAAFSLVASASGALIPLADPTQSGMLRQVSGLTTDVVDGTNHCVDLASSPAIGLGRLRGFNAIGNSSFEVDQVSAGATVANANAKICDRWFVGKAGTSVVSAGQQAATLPDVCLPGTNFRLTRNFFRVSLTTAQASLAASDFIQLYQVCEGPQWRELSNDVHSVSLLVRSSVAGLNFGVAIRDPSTSTKSLTKLATIPTANTWTLLTFPNLPVFPTGNFNATAGQQGYLFTICLAAGTTLTAPANDTWQNGNFIGAPGQDNFASKALGSTFDVAFVQHEPGAKCTTLIDKPFTVNLDECLRYFQKSYNYAQAVGGNVAPGACIITVPASNHPYAPIRYPKIMARAVTPVIYSTAGGSNAVYDNQASTNRAVSSIQTPGDAGFGGCVLASVNAAVAPYSFHWVTDTGW